MNDTFKQWVYHKTKKPKVINSNEFEKLKAMGWSDTPADFILISDFGVDGKDPSAVQVLGEAIQGVADAANGALNINGMLRKDLEEYAIKHFSIDVSKFKSVKSLREAVNAYIKG
jgi:hypothetical protein